MDPFARKNITVMIGETPVGSLGTATLCTNLITFFLIFFPVKKKLRKVKNNLNSSNNSLLRTEENKF